MVSELVGGDWSGLRLIPLAPLGVALVLGFDLLFGRRSISRTGISVLAVAGLGASLVASILSFADLVFNEETSALTDRMFTWIGAGVGSSTLIGDLAFRFDPLSASISLVVSGVGFLWIVYAVRSPGLLGSGSSDRQRFYCIASFQLGMTLVFVLADNLLLMLIGFAGIGAGAYLFAGFTHADAGRSQRGAWVLTLGRAGDLALLVATLLIFRASGGAGTPSLGVEDVRAALLGLGGVAFALPVWTGLGEIDFLEVIGLCLFLASAGLAGQLLLSVGGAEDSDEPFVGLALMQTVTGFMASGYLIVRFSFVFSAAPLASGVLAVFGTATALVAAVFACRSHSIGRVLMGSSLSQLGLIMMASGLGAQTAAVFQLISHSFFKSLLLMAVGVVILALKGEQDLRRMGNLGSRLTLTRIGFWVGGFSLAGGLPLTAGFFSLQQIVVAAAGADPGFAYNLVYPAVLMTGVLTTFSVVRLIYLALYGKNRLASPLNREEVEDPESTILWLMGILATLSILGAVIGFPQLWADFFFSGEIDDSNSLHYFLSGVVSTRAEAFLDIGQTWAVSGWALVMTLLGGGVAIVVYAVKPASLEALAAFGRRQRMRWGTKMSRFEFRFPGDPRGRVEATWSNLHARIVASPISETGPLSVSAGLLRYLADRVLKRIQSGFIQHSLALSLAGSLGLLVYFLWAGGI